MMLNNLCDTCEHLLVCCKIPILKHFDEYDKSYIGIDIEMLHCGDFLEIEDNE